MDAGTGKLHGRISEVWRVEGFEFRHLEGSEDGYELSTSGSFKKSLCGWGGVGGQQLLCRNVKRFRGGLVFKVHRLCTTQLQARG